MRVRRLAALVALGLLVAAGHPVRAERDEAKDDCRRACEFDLRSCKQDCQRKREGTGQTSYLYVECDTSCQVVYAGCKEQCVSPDR